MLDAVDTVLPLLRAEFPFGNGGIGAHSLPPSIRERLQLKWLLLRASPRRWACHSGVGQARLSESSVRASMGHDTSEIDNSSTNELAGASI